MLKGIACLRIQTDILSYGYEIMREAARLCRDGCLRTRKRERRYFEIVEIDVFFPLRYFLFTDVTNELILQNGEVLCSITALRHFSVAPSHFISTGDAKFRPTGLAPGKKASRVFSVHELKLPGQSQHKEK